MPEKFDFSKIEDQQKFESLPQEEKVKIKDEVEEKALLMQEKIKGGEADDYYEAEKMVEREKEKNQDVKKELSPEVVEKIMEKVQDINKFGTAVTFKDIESLDSVLKSGLLGSVPKSVLRFADDKFRELISQYEQNYERPAAWAKIFRKTKANVVWFNIVGRFLSEKVKKGSSDQTMHDLYPEGIESDFFCAILDVSRFKEVNAGPWVHSPVENSVPKLDTFRSDDSTLYGVLKLLFGESIPVPLDDRLRKENIGRLLIEKKAEVDNFLNSDIAIGNKIKTAADLKDFFTEDGFTRSTKDYGFVFNGRVAPRLIKGLVIEKETLKMIEEKILEIYEDKQSLLMPIYDIDGNLLWPKKMSEEEVKKFVAEKDKKKENPPQPSFKKEGEER